MSPRELSDDELAEFIEQVKALIAAAVLIFLQRDKTRRDMQNLNRDNEADRPSNFLRRCIGQLKGLRRGITDQPTSGRTRGPRTDEANWPLRSAAHRRS